MVEEDYKQLSDNSFTLLVNLLSIDLQLMKIKADSTVAIRFNPTE